MKRLIAALVFGTLLAVACGVRSAPRPPHPDPGPATGDPNMVPVLPSQPGPRSNALPNEPAYGDAGPRWFNRDAGVSPEVQGVPQ